jgi:ribosomal protein S18 acetylase RimI-like enzyme
MGMQGKFHIDEWHLSSHLSTYLLMAPRRSLCRIRAAKSGSEAEWRATAERGAQVSPVLDLRRARPSDVADIRELIMAAYAKWVPVIGRAPKPMTVDYAEVIRQHRFDLLHVGDSLAGLIETCLAIDHLLIVNVAVAPQWQRRGFGARLMAHAEQMAMASGLREVRLYTDQLLVDNIRFYRNLGYEVAQEEAVTVGVIVHMRKALAEPERAAGDRMQHGSAP